MDGFRSRHTGMSVAAQFPGGIITCSSQQIPKPNTASSGMWGWDQRLGSLCHPAMLCRPCSFLLLTCRPRTGNTSIKRKHTASVPTPVPRGNSSHGQGHRCILCRHLAIVLQPPRSLNDAPGEIILIIGPLVPSIVCPPSHNLVGEWS